MANNCLSSVMDNLPQMKLDEEQEAEYLAILEVFTRFLEETWPSLSDSEEIITALSDLRAEFGVHSALEGMGLGYEEALELIRTNAGLSEEDEEKRKVVVAAIDNIVEFSVMEEYHMLEEIEDALQEVEIESEEDLDIVVEEIMLAIFEKYHRKFMITENMDIKYAMTVAAALVSLESSIILTYRTQGDERVRPWHAAFEGYAAPKRDFPAWLIPPIEHGCRCFLTIDREAANRVEASVVRHPQMPEWFNRSFKESVALGGRIFSDEHPYFQVQAEHTGMLDRVSENLKIKYFNA